MLSYSIFKELEVKVSKSVVLAFHQKEFRAIIWQLEKYTFADPEYQSMILGMLNRPFWVIKQYQMTAALEDLRGTNTKEYPFAA